MTQQIGKYPSTFYRVSLKAIIRNSDGHVLVVKATDDAFGSMWDLPGGGMEHGDDEESTFVKELYEEALIEAPIVSLRYKGMTPRYTEFKEVWWLGIFYEVELPEDFTFGVGADGAEVQFIDPEVFQHSSNITEQLVYKWTVLADK